ncbi:MAG: flavoprotein [Halanaerobium sp.]
MAEVSVELISRIVKEVLKSLNLEQKTILNKKKITAVFTGGKIDYQKSMDQLEKLDNKFEADWQLIFSKSAEEILDSKKIAAELGAEIVDPKKALKNIKDRDLIIVPILTMNSAAKLASHFLDTDAVYYIFKSLILGVPVIAAKNAADLNGEGWQEFGLDKLPEPLLADNQKHLSKLQSYGIKVIDAAEITDTALKILDADNTKNESSNNGNFNKEINIENDKTNRSTDQNTVFLDSKVITYREINPLADYVEFVHVREDAVITPYARDIAENKGMIICS